MPFFPSRPLSLVLFATSLVFSAAGCKTKCENIGGRTVCTAKSLSGYVGTTVPREVSWTPGQPIDIVVDGGNVRVGTVASLAVQVLPYEATKNPSPNQVYVEFTPVIAIPADEKEKGIQQMTTQLTLSATATAGGPVRVAVTPTGTTDSSLSASVRLYLPANFNGDLNVTNSAGGKTNGDLSVQGVTGAVRVLTSTGSITVNGVGSTIDAQTGVGDVTVVFGSPPVASATGKLVTELGNIALTLKQASNVSLQAQASSPDGLVLAPDPLPAGWQMAVSAPTAKSFTGNAGNAAPWFLDASQGVKSTVTFTLVP